MMRLSANVRDSRTLRSSIGWNMIYSDYHRQERWRPVTLDSPSFDLQLMDGLAWPLLGCCSCLAQRAYEEAQNVGTSLNIFGKKPCRFVFVKPLFYQR
jgi:hypothetical protein